MIDEQYCHYGNSASIIKSKKMIAPFWDDLRTDISGPGVSSPGVYYWSPAPGFRVFQWEATHYSSSTYSIIIQLVLYYDEVRFTITYANNFNNFSPTSGISKASAPDYIPVSIGPQITIKFDLDNRDIFYYDRCCSVFGLPAPKYLSLTPSGWLDYGNVRDGPPNSRDFTPDQSRLEWHDNPQTSIEETFINYFKFTENLYSNAQNWEGGGVSFAFVVEFNIEEDSLYDDSIQSINHRWTNVPGAGWSPITGEVYGSSGVHTAEFDIRVHDPQNIPINNEYHVGFDAWIDELYESPTRHLYQTTVVEYELYHDHFPWDFLFVNQRDYYKIWIGDWWISEYNVHRYGSGTPKNLLYLSSNNNFISAINNSNFYNGKITIRSDAFGEYEYRAQIYRSPSIDSLNKLENYIKTRHSILLESSLDKNERYPVSITFNQKMSIDDIISFVHKNHINLQEIGFIGNNNVSGMTTISEINPLNQDIFKDLTKKNTN
jgi:hypothetical protein